MHNLAIAFIKVGRVEEGYQAERQALQRFSDGNVRIKYKGHLLLAATQLEMGNDIGAVQNLKASIILNSRCADAYKLLSKIYLKHGAVDNAKNVLKVSLNLNIADEEAWRMLKEIRG